MPETGDLIGPFRLISQLGRGAMGEVWRARDERLDRYVALKVLPPEASEDIERRARMLREARAAAAIRHANVVTLFDIVSHDGEDILVMELVEGRTLSEVLRKDGPPSLEIALTWIHGVCDALAAAHDRGILHRDIKAANIMVTGDKPGAAGAKPGAAGAKPGAASAKPGAAGAIKILDFGLAKLRDNEPMLPLTAKRVVELGEASKPVRARGTDPELDGQRAIELDHTMPSAPAPAPRRDVSLDATHRDGVVADDALAVESYRTHAGQLLGTPLYMAPEQVHGQPPDERSEVFSVGILAYEILTGKPPYTAATLDGLFRQITDQPLGPLPDVPDAIEAIVLRAAAKDRDRRFPSMGALRDAIHAERARLFAPPARRWPLVVAAGVLALGAIAAFVTWRVTRPPPPRPGDEYVARALEEYDVFYNEKAISSLRAAVAVAPDHPRANAYMILFGGASDADRTKALTAAKKAQLDTDEHTKDRALLDAAIAMMEKGPVAARAAIDGSGAPSDRELAFWAAELDYRAANYAVAREEYRALLIDPAHAFRGRIYDHDSSVLLYLDEPDEALRIGQLYRDAFPGEADAVGVYATTLGAAGQTEKAIAAAEEALRLSEGEDTLAGLAKVTALAGDHGRARELYQRSLDRAGPARRPIRRAALALLQWIDGDAEMAKQTVAPCLPGGVDSSARERGACLFVAGVIDPARGEDIAKLLDALAAEATDAKPAYGAPASLARLVRARAVFFGGACLVDRARPDVAPATPGEPDTAAYDVTLDFYAAYHVPYFATWAVCEQAAAFAARGNRKHAAELLEVYVKRAPHRTWLENTLARYR